MTFQDRDYDMLLAKARGGCSWPTTGMSETPNLQSCCAREPERYNERKTTALGRSIGGCAPPEQHCARLERRPYLLDRRQALPLERSIPAGVKLRDLLFGEC
jgi:hypothetical protein